MSDRTAVDTRETGPACRENAPNVSCLPKSGRIASDCAYGDPVARESDEIDRAAWAQLLKELLDAAGMTPEQASYQTGGPVSVSWRTLRRWQAQEHGVSAARVRDVCRELGYEPVEALVRVGFFSREEARLTRAPAAVASPLPPLLRQIMDVLTDKRIPDDVKGHLRQAVAAAFDVWASMYKLRAPRERPARDRSNPSVPK